MCSPLRRYTPHPTSFTSLSPQSVCIPRERLMAKCVSSVVAKDYTHTRAPLGTMAVNWHWTVNHARLAFHYWKELTSATARWLWTLWARTRGESFFHSEVFYQTSDVKVCAVFTVHFPIFWYLGLINANLQLLISLSHKMPTASSLGLGLYMQSVVNFLYNYCLPLSFSSHRVPTEA